MTDTVEQLTAETIRIAELEAMLSKTIAYMRSLQPIPRTYHLANEAEEVLTKGITPTVRYGARTTAAGVVVIAAKITGDKITVVVPTNEGSAYTMREKLRASLNKMLPTGVDITIDPNLGQSSYIARVFE